MSKPVFSIQSTP